MALTGLAVIALAMALGYALLLGFYLRHWSKMQSLQPSHQQDVPVSIVIAARNEASTIRQCLQSILSQGGGGTFEVIVVDDHSDDSTAENVRAFEKVRLISMKEGSGAQGKKAALALGIREARHELIVTTDADCIVGPHWLQCMIDQFDTQVQAVTGPVCYREGKGLLEQFQAMEILGLMVVTGGGLASGKHVLGNGANMAFRRSAYDKVQGYKTHGHLASGDDLFLLEQIAKAFPGSVRYVKSREAVVHTFPQKTWNALIQQRLRWSSKNTALEDRSINVVWGMVWLVHLVLLIAVAAVPVMPLAGKLIVAGAIVIKAYMDHRLLSAAATLADKRLSMLWFIPSFVLNFIYVLYIGMLTVLTQRYEWKGRTTS